jgi:hypothetical protein
MAFYGHSREHRMNARKARTKTHTKIVKEHNGLIYAYHLENNKGHVLSGYFKTREEAIKAKKRYDAGKPVFTK